MWTNVMVALPNIGGALFFLRPVFAASRVQHILDLRALRLGEE